MCADLYLNFSDVTWTYKKTHAEKREFFYIVLFKIKGAGRNMRIYFGQKH